jgi:hypothetical protein
LQARHKFSPAPQAKKSSAAGKIFSRYSAGVTHFTIQNDDSMQHAQPIELFPQARKFGAAGEISSRVASMKSSDGMTFFIVQTRRISWTTPSKWRGVTWAIQYLLIY